MGMELYISAAEAAAELGVSVQTLYTYVSRKQIRSQKLEGTRERRYWKPDIERVKGGERLTGGTFSGLKQDTDITLVTSEGPFYRGESGIKLSDTYSLEQLAAHLWQIAETEAFSDCLPVAPPELNDLAPILKNASSTDKAIALLPFLESANPRAFDFSHRGMCRSGADVLRWYAAILTDRDTPSADPLHIQIGSYINGGPEIADLVRRLLVLSADHGFRAGAYAVRAVASTGVSPYRAVLAGFAITRGRRTHFGRIDGIKRMLDELSESPDPKSVIIRRLQEGEQLPGFDTLSPYVDGDPRAYKLLGDLENVFGDHKLFIKASETFAFVKGGMGMHPSFALVNGLLNHLVGLPEGKVLYILGRCAGWVAHSIEQYQAGSIEPPAANYRGSLPRPG